MLNHTTYHCNDHADNNCPSNVNLMASNALDGMHLPKQIQVYQ